MTSKPPLRFQVEVAQQDLDNRKADPVVEQMGGEGVPQRMHP
jgi:hypothetical protein